MVSFTKLLAVDRAAVTEFFTFDRAEKLQVNYAGDWLRAAAAFSDGGDTDATDFGEDPVEFALTGRADVKLAGSWKQAKDITAWPDDEMGLFLGLAGHHENGDGNNGRDDDYTAYTLDALFNHRGGSILAAFSHGFVDGDRNDGVANRQPFGVLRRGRLPRQRPARALRPLGVPRPRRRRQRAAPDRHRRRKLLLPQAQA